MSFLKYQHIERFGTSEVKGINEGLCYIFPKIDGTNASVWREDGVLCAGSRNRQLSAESDNAGFYKWVMDNAEKFNAFFDGWPDVVLYGEWLVPHTIKDYVETAWRDFYVFDVFSHTINAYIDVTFYSVELEHHKISYLEPIASIWNPDIEYLTEILTHNNHLMKEGVIGEGIVIKNYGFINRYGRTIWAKMVTAEFVKAHTGKEPAQIEKPTVERAIIHEFLTEAMIDKVHAKLVLDNDGFTSKLIPGLLNIVYYDLVREESWNFVKKLKNPVVDYKTLKYLSDQKVKTHFPEIFGIQTT